MLNPLRTLAVIAVSLTLAACGQLNANKAPAEGDAAEAPAAEAADSGAKPEDEAGKPGDVAQAPAGAEPDKPE